ncbi:MAG TPA: M48 family metalloprotease, partial [Acidobacteriaceae bacterium]
AKKEKKALFTPLTPEQTELLNRAMAREKVTVREIAKHTPVVQTYIQNLRPDPAEYQVPVSDQYIIGRVDFGKTFGDEQYDTRSTHKGLLHGSLKYVSGLSKAFELSYSPTGFMDMMFLDPVGFDQQHYEFNFVRREFLGSVRTTVFDVRPREKTGAGRFFGRIWVEDQDGNIVRFNGTYSSNVNDEETHYYHFDSWRSNMQEGVWLPAAIYVEESDHAAAAKAKGFRAQTLFWGYSLKLPASTTDNSSMQIENAQDQSENSQDVSPLQAQRLFITQAENNVLDRLVQAGLLAPPSDFDKVLETVANNIVIGNNITLPGDLHCRVLLTQPLESLAVGNTILMSKGLVDTLPTEEDLAALLSFELAHILLGHHIDTRYAFNDRLLFPDQAAFERITMNHTDVDNAAAAKKAIELFNGSVYKDKAPSVGLFFAQLLTREKLLPALLSPRLGDPLIKQDGTPWLAELGKGAVKLDINNLTQIAALPIGSHLRTDPWNDKVLALNAKLPPILNAGDKLPFAVTPVYLRLQRYQANAAPAVAQPVGQAPAATPAASAAQATTPVAPGPQ